jgi:hypothetical protein
MNKQNQSIPAPKIQYFRLVLLLMLCYSLDMHDVKPQNLSSKTKQKSDTLYEMNCDGRFTLGTTQYKLMYGYPYPFSTSHFVANINNQLASNSPRLIQTTYLKGTLKRYFVFGYLASTITYEFKEVLITQKLVPVDKDLNEMNGKNIPQYYK